MCTSHSKSKHIFVAILGFLFTFVGLSLLLNINSTFSHGHYRLANFFKLPVQNEKMNLMENLDDYMLEIP